MSPQYGAESLVRQALDSGKVKKKQPSAKKAVEASNKSSRQGENVIMLEERRQHDRGAVSKQQSRGRTQMKAAQKNQQQVAPETLQAPVTLEAVQALFGMLLAQQQASQVPQKKRSTRLVREMVQVSFQCERDVAEAVDKVFAELQLRGEVTSKREAYERLWKEGIKVVRQQASK